jgi:aminopeptidase N
LNVVLPQAATRGNKLTVTVNYHGHPKDGLVFAKDRDGKQSAMGDNWPNRVHNWIPSLDHPSAKATVSFTVSTPQAYGVIANGKIVSVFGSLATSVWKFEEAKPIPPYCMVVAINQGVTIKSLEQHLTQLVFNVPNKDFNYAPKGFSAAAPSLTFFSQTIAPYPYEKLALIIGATRFGGMENSSAIVFPSTLFDHRPNEKIRPRFGIPTHLEEVVAHEIAHQWFGDSVTESTWADLWLSEGFATYFAGLFVEKYDGEAAFREYMRDAAQRYFRFEQQRNLPIHDTSTMDLMALLNPNNYEKGAWVLHMLRTRLGDDAFFKGLRDYYNAHAGRNANSEDLRAALEKASRKNLKQFFARWVYGAGHPRYELGWGSMERRAVTSVVVRLNQTQEGDAFLDPVPIEFVVNGKKERRTIEPTGKSTTVSIRLPANPSAVTIDPDETLLKEAVSVKP